MAVLSTALVQSRKQGVVICHHTCLSLWGDPGDLWVLLRGITVTEHCPYCPHGVPCEDDSLSLSPSVRVTV